MQWTSATRAPSGRSACCRSATACSSPTSSCRSRSGGRGRLRAVEEATRREGLIFVASQRVAEVDDPSFEDLLRVRHRRPHPQGAEDRRRQHERHRPGPEAGADGGDLSPRSVHPRQPRVHRGDRPDRGRGRGPGAPGAHALRAHRHPLAQPLQRPHRERPPAGENPNRLADFIAFHLESSIEEKQKLLETLDVKERLGKLLLLLGKELESSRSARPSSRRCRRRWARTSASTTCASSSRRSRRSSARTTSAAGELEELREKIEAAKMPEEAEKVARQASSTASPRCTPSAAEYTVSRTYLDWLVELPWASSTEDNLDIERRARRSSTRTTTTSRRSRSASSSTSRCASSRRDMKGPILCFVGPPGVGKTSLGRRSRARSAASSCASRSAACATRPRSAATAAPTSARCPAASSRACKQGRHQQPGLHARRDRQARRRLPRRPVGGAARGARPRAEPHLLRPLPRRAVRPLAR